MIILPHRRKAFRAGGGGFTDPSDIAGLELWLDFSDSTTIFDATSGGSLPADGASIKRIEDKSGNARHATEGTNCPIRKTAIINGLDVSRWTADGAKILTSTIASISQPYTIFSVWQSDGSINSSGFNFVHDSTTGGRAAIGRGSAVWYAEAGSGKTFGTPDTNVNACRVVYDGASSVFDINGSNITSQTFGTNATGTLFYIGNINPTGSYQWRGDMGEILIYSGAITGTDATNLVDFLMTKWGI